MKLPKEEAGRKIMEALREANSEMRKFNRLWDESIRYVEEQIKKKSPTP
jgi:hypothetical protein